MEKRMDTPIRFWVVGLGCRIQVQDWGFRAQDMEKSMETIVFLGIVEGLLPYQVPVN